MLPGGEETPLRESLAHRRPLVYEPLRACPSLSHGHDSRPRLGSTADRPYRADGSKSQHLRPHVPHGPAARESREPPSDRVRWLARRVRASEVDVLEPTAMPAFSSFHESIRPYARAIELGTQASR